ncbi:hypothetical protein GGD83_004781 [Rhodoblastus sphagnicola]|nr:hypothetical protein [Rhodoblastus sphagnicola]
MDKQMTALRRGIDRLIDSYANGFVEKLEFEPRITGMRQRLSQLKEHHEAAVRAAESERDLCLVISRVEEFAAKVSDQMDKLDRAGQREIIRALIKCVEVDSAGIEIIFRVPPPNAPTGPASSPRNRSNWQQCTAVRRAHLCLARKMPEVAEGLRKPDAKRLGLHPPRLNPPHAAKALLKNLNFPDRL